MPVRDHHIALQIRELQERIATGDETAFTQLYIHFNHNLVQFANSIVRSRESAEELVEDVFVKLWAGRNKLTQIENLPVYLYVAVKNSSLTRLSQKARELVSAPFDFLDTNLDDFSSDPEDLLITGEMMAAMQQAIDELPPRCKMIFRLIRHDGLRYKEVAEIMGISVNTIDAQMAIAVRKICEALHISQTSRYRFHHHSE